MSCAVGFMSKTKAESFASSAVAYDLTPLRG